MLKKANIYQMTGLLKARFAQTGNGCKAGLWQTVRAIRQVGLGLADPGYRGHAASISQTFKIYTSGEKRRMPPAIKREMKRRAAIEPVIGHIEKGHRMDRNYLASTPGDAINAIFASAEYNFRLLLIWLRPLLRLFLAVLLGSVRSQYA